jgi:hypothetical protein
MHIDMQDEQAKATPFWLSQKWQETKDAIENATLFSDH